MSEILYEKVGRVATLTINRPQSRNGMTIPSVMKAHERLLEANNDPDVSVLVLRGAGNDFCCGADLKHTPAPGEPTDFTDPRQYETSALLYGMRPVTVAAIRGGCAGAGLGWACACDIRVADTTARFNSAFLTVGLAGDMGLPWLLTRILGAAKAREISMFPGKIDPQAALQMGLISRLFEPDAFEEGLRGMTSHLESMSPVALKTMKSAYVTAELVDFPTFIKFETANHLNIFSTEDRVEAFRAYVEKRAPNYTGR